MYSGNLVHLNYKSILRNTGFQILDIEYEYSFVSLSSSRRDEDLNSEFDKFELVKWLLIVEIQYSKPLELLESCNFISYNVTSNSERDMLENYKSWVISSEASL